MIATFRFLCVLCVLCGSALSCSLFASQPLGYRFEEIPVPKDIVLEAGGMAYWPDGTLVICTRRGDIFTLKGSTWKRYATGLHEPLGLAAGANGEVWVVQRPELTHIKDVDGDGVADSFETVCAAWGVSGNYHEFSYGPVIDKDGNFWGTLNLANTSDPISKCEMGSTAAYRGWSFKITPKGEFIPWSSGLRSPNGIGMNLEGDFFCTDNQGGWMGTSFLHHLARNAFHGQPGGLRWDKSVKDLEKMTVADFDKMRKRPAASFPHGSVANSPCEPRWDTTGGKFGPFAGQAFCGDNSRAILTRIALEKVGGEYQGAVFPFWEGNGIGSGLNRLAWAPDGSLMIGCSARGWGAGDGLRKISWTGDTPMEIHSISVTRNGFDLNFTQPVDPVAALKPESYSIQHFHYLYHATYGSPQTENTPVDVKEIKISDDRKRVSLVLPTLKLERIYEIRAKGVKSEKGVPLGNSVGYYTLNRARE